MAATNTGYKAYSKLVKVTDDGTDRPLDANNELAAVSGRPQSVKNNANTDPNYISPVQDLVLCPKGAGPLYNSIQLAFYPNTDVCDKTKSSYQIHNQVFNEYSSIYNVNNSVAATGWYSDGTNKAYWNGTALSQYQACSAPAPAPTTETAPTTATYCPSLSDFSPSLATAIPMTKDANGVYSSSAITYIGANPINTTLRWYASGQSSYPGLPNAPYDNAIKTALSLTNGQIFKLSHYIGSAEDAYSVTVNAKLFECSIAPATTTEPAPAPAPVLTTESRSSLGGNPPDASTGFSDADGTMYAEGYEDSGYVTYYTNAEKTTQVVKEFVGTHYHLGVVTPAPCLSFTHYGIISQVNVGAC